MSEIITKPHTIRLRGGEGQFEEAIAVGVIKPGHLVSLASTGKVAVNAAAGAACEKMFALEDALQGRTITHAYAADELVSLYIAQPGDLIYAFLSGGEDAETGEKLTSNGDGALKVASGGDIPIGVAVEDVDASDSSGTADERIRVRIL